MKRHIRAKLCCCLLLAVGSKAAFAEMYKWVDADGNTHYTQQPPPAGIEATTIKPPPKVDAAKAQAQLQARQQRLQALRDGRIKSEQASQERQQDLAQKQAQCEQAKARLASYQRPRVNLVDADGSRVRASEEQRQAEIARSREYVAELCK